MKSLLLRLMSSLLLLTVVISLPAQVTILPPLRRCETMEEMNRSIRNHPGILEEWKKEGERRFKAALAAGGNGNNRTAAGPIIIPIVFHIVDSAQRQAWVTDRDVYEQVESLNRDYAGLKGDNYRNVVPTEIYNRIGRVPIKFVLARRAPDGSLTSGIERRVAASPNHINIKSFAKGGLDVWDSSRYVNVWCGTFSGSENGLLGIATFPFSNDQGGQGVVIGTATLPFTSPTARSYYPTYSEAATLSHELGHYFYLWHTFGDNAACNNDDFRIQDGWPLANGAGPEGDDTPDQKGNPSTDGFVYGNPSLNYNVGCISVPYGIVYGSFMNYFDDRALFMFTNGQRKRVESCIDLYRPGLKTSNGATPPQAVTDAFLVTVNPRGTPEKRMQFINNTLLQAVVRNAGTTTIGNVTVTLRVDASAAASTSFSLALAPGADTTLSLGALTAATGSHNLTIYTSVPNGGTDTFTNNDSLMSYITVIGGTINAPFTESFTATTFPPLNWSAWNPNGGTAAWARSGTSGFPTAGAATFSNYSFNQSGTLDELISPAISFGTSDSAVLSFNVAYGVYDNTDVSTWDGLEVYLSADGGATYRRAYKKTGALLKTIDAPQTGSFSATPAQPERWRNETVNLTPFLIPGKSMIVKFRNTNAFGNNLFVDEVSITTSTLPTRDARALAITNVRPVLCGGTSISPSFTFGNNGKDTLTSLKINFRLDNGAVTTLSWTGTLARLQTDTRALGTLSNLTAGTHVLTVYTSDPNGLADQVPSNDTLTLSLQVLAPVLPPVRESFENAVFPPPNWVVVKGGSAYSWERTTRAAKDGVASAVIRNYRFSSNGTHDDLYAPLVQLSAPDSVFALFDLAHVTAQYPGSTSIQLDTLEVLLTQDCGLTFKSVYKKWGDALQTNGDRNFPAVYPADDTVGFVPNVPGLWRGDSINLSPYLAGSNGTFQLVFHNTSSHGNNTYLDNVNISSLTLPAKLKSQGYLVAPNPTTGQLTVRHYLPPVTLKGLEVITPSGQVIIQRVYNGNALSTIPIDLSHYANGIYSIRMQYTDKVIVTRIIKIK